MERLYERVAGGTGERMASGTGEPRLQLSAITRASVGFVGEEIEAQERQFQKRLGRVGEKAREKMGGFGEEMRLSHEKIMAALEAVHELTALWEQEGAGQAASVAKRLKKRIDHHKHKVQILQKQYPPVPPV